MPSDAQLAAALEFTAEARERFLSSVRLAADQVDAHIRTHGAPVSAAAERVTAELGAFAEGRIDAGRIASFGSKEVPLDDRSLARLHEAGEVLSEVSKLEPDDFVVPVGEGEYVADAVISAMARLGRAFTAAELANRARMGMGPATGEWVEEQVAEPSPQEWRPGAHAVAPPLVVIVPGGALDLAPLRTVLEGNACIVILCEGACPPAPLAPLLSPDMRLLQTTDVADLEQLGSRDGPTVVAVLPEGSAVWMHDPAGGETPGERITVRHLPEVGDVRPVRGVSEWRQREDLRHLASLAAASGRPLDGADRSANGQAATPAEPVDMLAAWLIKQADVPAAG